jgi:hypothetical protein
LINLLSNSNQLTYIKEMRMILLTNVDYITQSFRSLLASSNWNPKKNSHISSYADNALLLRDLWAKESILEEKANKLGPKRTKTKYK